MRHTAVQSAYRDPSLPASGLEFFLPWWSHPAGLALGFLLPIVLAIAMMRGIDHPGLMVRGLLFLDAPYVALAAGLLILLACGAWLGEHLSLVPESVLPARRSHWDLPAMVLGAVAVAAYSLWFKDYLFDPVLMWQTLTGEHRPTREVITLTPGLTSLVNFSPVFFATFAYRLAFSSPQEPVPLGFKALAVVLVLLVVFRAYAWSERLAIIETAIPLLLAAVVRWLQPNPLPRSEVDRDAPRRRSGRLSRPRRPSRMMGVARKAVLAGGPYLGIPAVIGLFGAFEFFRSWSTDTYHGKMDFIDFAVGRFLTYYFTSLNNGAGMLEMMDWPSYRMDYVLLWAHRARAGLFKDADSTIGDSKYDVSTFLNVYGDEEFNSPSAFFSIVLDLGVPLGGLFMFALGTVAGMACRAYRRGSLVGVLAYPTVLITFLELFRYFYLGEPRAVTVVLGMVLMLLGVKLTSEFGGTVAPPRSSRA